MHDKIVLIKATAENRLAHDKWLACITIEGKRHDLGIFDREEDAARAYSWAVGMKPRWDGEDE